MTTSSSNKPFRRILLTGAGGGLGKVLRPRLQAYADVVRLSDIVDLGPAGEGEEVVTCDLADGAAVHEMMKDVDVVLHFGGVSVEERFEPILQANILGTYNLYAAAHKLGIKRIVFASSNHVTGFYRNNELVDPGMPHRPDGFYGISKSFGEDLSRYYFDRCGIETVCLRIGSSFPEPRNARMLITYLSYDDLEELIRCAMVTPRVGHTIAYGISDNDATWWDNRKAGHLGYRAKDSSRPFAAKFANTPAPADDDLTALYQGGPFITIGPKY